MTWFPRIVDTIKGALGLRGLRLDPAPGGQQLSAYIAAVDGLPSGYALPGPGLVIDTTAADTGGLVLLTVDGTTFDAIEANSDFGSSGIAADVIAESTAAAGVTVDGVLVKDNTVTASTLSTGALGVTGVADIADGGRIALRGGGDTLGDEIVRVGGSDTEGLVLRVFDDVITPTGVETNVIEIPANSRLLSVQSNVATDLTGGGTTDSYGVGLTGDPDAYGSSATLTQNSKSDWLGDGTVLSSATQIVLTGTASETADGDTALTVGTVRIRIAYLTLDSLDDAA